MRTAVVLALVLIATSCTGDVERSSPSASFESNPSTPEPVPSPITALPFEGLRLGPRTPTDGWVVMADGFGVHVAGGGTLGNVDPRTGRPSHFARIGDWDYDFTHLGRLGEGSLWLASGHDLWLIAGSPQYVIGRRYDLDRLGYLGAVLQASLPAGGGTWMVATGAQATRRVRCGTRSGLGIDHPSVPTPRWSGSDH